MIRRDKLYKQVENITIGCYICGLALACVTKFIPFILLTALAYPISLKTINKSGRA